LGGTGERDDGPHSPSLPSCCCCWIRRCGNFEASSARRAPASEEEEEEEDEDEEAPPVINPPPAVKRSICLMVESSERMSAVWEATWPVRREWKSSRLRSEAWANAERACAWDSIALASSWKEEAETGVVS